MISSAEKTKRKTSSAGLAIFGFTSKKIHINTSANIHPSASTSVCNSSTHLAASSSPPSSLLRDDVALARVPLNVPSALIQTQVEIDKIDVLSSSERSTVKALAKSIPNDISFSDNEPPP